MDNKKHLDNTITRSTGSPGQSTASDGDPVRLDSYNPRSRTAEAPVALSEALTRLSPNDLEPWHPRKLERTISRTIHQNWRDTSVVGKATLHHPIRRAPKRSDAEALRTKQKAHAVWVCHELMGTDPLQSLTKNYENIMADWTSLKNETAIPNNASSSHPRIIHAFKAVDSVICGRQGSTLLRRLAYVQLMRLFAFLQDIIRFERETGRVVRGRYCRDASVALDIYMSAQEGTSNPDDLRRQLKERKRAGRSWKILSKPSPLFVLLYSDAAESIMYVHIFPSITGTMLMTYFSKNFKSNNATVLKLVAAQVLEECPTKLIHLCTRLDNLAEVAAKPRCPPDTGENLEEPSGPGYDHLSESTKLRNEVTGREASLHTSNQRTTSTIDLSDDVFLYPEEKVGNSPKAIPWLLTVPDDCHQPHGEFQLPPLNPRKAAKSAMENKGHLQVNTGRFSSLSQSLRTERQSPVSDPLGTTREDSITSDLMHADSSDQKLSFGSGAWEKPLTGNRNSVRSEIKRDPLRKVSQGRYDKQKR